MYVDIYKSSYGGASLNNLWDNTRGKLAKPGHQTLQGQPVTKPEVPADYII